MPRETIYGSGAPINVSVAWGNNETVQVATIHDRDDDARAMLRIVNDWLDAADMEKVDINELVARLDRKGTPARFDGWHATLDDWPGVNRLIKVLKRARDQAFGSPE